MDNSSEREQFFIRFGTRAVFESFRVEYSSTENHFLISGLNLHLLRLQKSTTTYQLKKFDLTEITEKLSKFLHENFNKLGSSTEYYLRIVNSKVGIELFLVPFELNVASSVSACTYNGERSDPEIKSTNITLSTEARAYAYQNNHYEALLVDREGNLREGAWTNFFWIDKDCNFHTPLNGILQGITREQIKKFLEFNQMPLSEKDCSVAEIKEKIDSSFICNSLQGIVILSRIDDLKLANSFDLDNFKSRFTNYQRTQMEILC